MRSRLDLEMTRRGLAESREAAQRLIMAGRVRVNSRPAAKADLRVDDAAPIELIGGPREYASRGAYKLLAALEHFAT
ncbi:MAG: S4 domain-containing protein, partial [Candidatus Binataceae bacterium]